MRLTLSVAWFSAFTLLLLFWERGRVVDGLMAWTTLFAALYGATVVALRRSRGPPPIDHSISCTAGWPRSPSSESRMRWSRK